MAQIREKVDVCVVGAGHAGCEAALACARMGLETVIFTVSVDSIALMPVSYTHLNKLMAEPEGAEFIQGFQNARQYVGRFSNEAYVAGDTTYI